MLKVHIFVYLKLCCESTGLFANGMPSFYGVILVSYNYSRSCDFVGTMKPKRLKLKSPNLTQR